MYSANDALRAVRGKAETAVILGSGLSHVASAAETVQSFPYAAIRGFRETTVAGHPGFLSLGRIGGAGVFLFAGRFHGYEGGDPGTIAASVSLSAFLGCRRVIVTNAAGSLIRPLPPGTWMLASDVVSFPARSAPTYRGPSSRESARGLGCRANATPLVSERLAAALREAARAASVPLAEGVLCWTSGPAYETAAEARAAALMGADAATMSSLPELIAARSMGVEAASLSWITNYTAHISGERTDHAHVVGMGAEGVRTLLALLVALLRAPKDG